MRRGLKAGRIQRKNSHNNSYFYMQYPGQGAQPSTSQVILTVPLLDLRPGLWTWLADDKKNEVTQ